VLTSTDHDHYGRWVRGRHAALLGTNLGSEQIAFQSWHNFKEAFAPELVARAVRESDTPVKCCFDPFGGSGTTALTCQMLGIDSVTFEVNPFLADVIRAKLSCYDIDRLAQALANVRKLTRRVQGEFRERLDHLPATFVEPGVSARWLFNRDVAQRLAATLDAIQEVCTEDDARLFRVLIGGILPDVSNVIVSGKGRRYRKNWRTNSINASSVDALFSMRAETALRDILQFRRRPKVDAAVMQGDSRELVPPRRFDLAVFSPPYPNSFDYTDVYNLQLWVLGYLRDAGDNRQLRDMSSLSGHTRPHPRGRPCSRA
jgi:DNA methylase